MLHNTQDRYGLIARSLHWLAAACILAAWGLGQGVDAFPKAWEPGVVAWHGSFGLIVIAALLVRLGWRMLDPPPPALPDRLGPLAVRAAHATHWLLYALMLAAPVVGIVLQFARGQPLSLFGLAEIASPWPRDRAFARSVKEVHELLSNAILVLAGLHAAAALMHHYVLKDDTLRRMLPGRR